MALIIDLKPSERIIIGTAGTHLHGGGWLIVEHGYDRPNGARPLARLIAEKIKKPLADEVLFGKLTKGGEVTVIVKDDDLAFKIKSSPKSKKAAEKEEEGELV